jgi:hypothetical protein
VGARNGDGSLRQLKLRFLAPHLRPRVAHNFHGLFANDGLIKSHRIPSYEF